MKAQSVGPGDGETERAGQSKGVQQTDKTCQCPEKTFPAGRQASGCSVFSHPALSVLLRHSCLDHELGPSGANSRIEPEFWQKPLGGSRSSSGRHPAPSGWRCRKKCLSPAPHSPFPSHEQRKGAFSAPEVQAEGEQGGDEETSIGTA